MEFNKRNRILLLIILLLFAAKALLAEEGMYTPLQIKLIAASKMKALGLTLESNDIYDVSKASIKDAIVMLNGGMCSAEIVSEQGLVLTNHHCAYQSIQSHSSVAHDYLTDGFWASSKEKELTNEGMTASIVQRITDVSQRILSKTDTLAGEEKQKAIKEEIKKIIKEATEDTHFNAEVKPFYFGTEYYLFVYETFKDIRLVGAPPEAIGKFGGDTDNWMWTRHTGDFAMLRIYADSAGKPASYAATNMPYKPKHYLPLSIAPKKEDDFTMIMGFPGSTERYLPSKGVALYQDKMHPERIKVREKKLGVMKAYMREDNEVRIKYASKYARISNYWKYFIGQRKGLKRLNILGQKMAEEKAFEAWISANDTSAQKYKHTLDKIENAYKTLDSTTLAYVYFTEAFLGIELFTFAATYTRYKKDLQNYRKKAEEHFKNYDLATDQALLANMMKLYIKEVPRAHTPTYLLKTNLKYKGDFEKYAKKIMKRSLFATEKKVMKFIQNPRDKKYKNDPAVMAFFEMYNFYKRNLSPIRKQAYDSLLTGQKEYVCALKEMKPAKLFYPDANSTLRLSYGTIKPYSPADASFYNYQTYGTGILEKEDNENPEFTVPEKLISLLEKKDFGAYGVNGKIPVNFITTNDITGGNSGSGVLNEKGELIGIAFDGNWEAMSGDIAFAPSLQRTISVDIRYVLFIIDKYAEASHLIDEMEIRH